MAGKRKAWPWNTPKKPELFRADTGHWMTHEPAGYRALFEFDALFTKAGQPAGACRLRRKKFDAFEIYRHRIFHKSSASARKALRRFSPARQGFEVVCSNHFDAF
jgi:hypothetical protein